jgi:hypothetical protein
LAPPTRIIRIIIVIIIIVVIVIGQTTACNTVTHAASINCSAHSTAGRTVPMLCLLRIARLSD